MASAFLLASSPASRAAATETIIEKSGHQILFISRHPKSIHTHAFLLVELFYSYSGNGHFQRRKIDQNSAKVIL